MPPPMPTPAPLELLLERLLREIELSGGPEEEEYLFGGPVGSKEYNDYMGITGSSTAGSRTMRYQPGSSVPGLGYPNSERPPISSSPVTGNPPVNIWGEPMDLPIRELLRRLGEE